MGPFCVRVAVGAVLLPVTVIVAVEVQPLLVTVTVYVPAVDTVVVAAVAPFENR